ncbi:MAG: peptidoglycan DD-metalloendopeptidase family protein [Gammaproteobacteria bacterium]|nr:peptidoglycan DD-metalloendopeptidase family protein [Gammaproteobacteria bacterium]
MYKSLCLALLMLAPSFAGAEATTTQRLENVQTEIKSLSKELGDTKASKNALYQQLKTQSQAASKLKRDLYKLDQSIKEQAEKIKILQTQYDQQQQAHSKQLNALNKQLRAAFTNAQPNYLKVLLNQHDPAKLSRSSTYFHYFHQARQQQLASINETLVTLSSQQHELKTAQQDQQELYKQRQHQQTQLEQKNQQRLITLNQLDQKLDAQSTRISALREEEQSLQAVFKSLQEKQEKKTTTQLISTSSKAHQNFASLKGALPWPIKGKVTARYGSARNLGKLTWQGIMIDAPSGKEVNASAAGQVVFSGWLRGFGLLIIVDHGDKYMSLYGNNQSLLKEVGDTVEAGELIALSGDKGIRQHAGLYFEIRHKGSPTNPSQWLGKQS